MFESKYDLGFVKEYLTPACAAKLITISNLLYLNKLLTLFKSLKSIFLK